MKHRSRPLHCFTLSLESVLCFRPINLISFVVSDSDCLPSLFQLFVFFWLTFLALGASSFPVGLPFASSIRVSLLHRFTPGLKSTFLNKSPIPYRLGTCFLRDMPSPIRAETRVTRPSCFQLFFIIFLCFFSAVDRSV